MLQQGHLANGLLYPLSLVTPGLGLIPIAVIALFGDKTGNEEGDWGQNDYQAKENQVHARHEIEGHANSEEATHELGEEHHQAIR